MNDATVHVLSLEACPYNFNVLFISNLEFVLFKYLFSLVYLLGTLYLNVYAVNDF